VTSRRNQAPSAAPLFDRAAAQVPPVQVQQIEGEIGELLRPARKDGILEIANVGDATIVRGRDLSVEDHLAAERDQPSERRPQKFRSIVSPPRRMCLGGLRADFGELPRCSTALLKFSVIRRCRSAAVCSSCRRLAVSACCAAISACSVAIAACRVEFQACLKAAQR